MCSSDLIRCLSFSPPHPTAPMNRTTISSLHHTSSRSPSTSPGSEPARQCASRANMSSRCVADYPIFYITCTNRWQGRWTTKPPLFTSNPTTTPTAHFPQGPLLPSNTLSNTPSNTTTIAFQSSRPSGVPLQASLSLHLHDPHSIHHTHPTNRSVRHRPHFTTERPSQHLSTTTTRCTPGPTRSSQATPLLKCPRLPVKMGRPPSPHHSPPSSH